MGWQFNPKGYPIYGPPNGFGLSQIDNSPSATEMQLWNWQANIDGGKNIFYNRMNAIKTKMKAHPTTNEEILKATYQAYNSDINTYPFFIWNPKNNQWDINPNLPNNYGQDVYNKYLKLIQ
jgi:hypothetical protein